MSMRLSNAVTAEEWSVQAGHPMTSAQPGPLVATTLQTEEQLLRIGPEWDGLFRQSGSTNPFLRFEWLMTWWKQWGKDATLFVITVRDQKGRLIAVAPLYRAKSGVLDLKANGLYWLASAYSGSDYLTVVVHPGAEEPVARVIVSELLRHRSDWDYIEWDHTLENDPAIRALREALGTAGCHAMVTPRNVCPYAALPRTFEEYLKTRSQNVRYNFKRRLKALQKEGPLALTVLRRPEDIEARFGELVRLHGSRFTSQEKASSFLAADVQTFHRKTLQACSDASIPRLFLLELNGVAIAALYGFSMGSRFLFFQSGMDPQWSRLSVGLVMMGSVIEHVIKDGHTEFDFLRGEEAYKFQWATGIRSTSIIRIFDRRPLSRWIRAHRTVRQQFGNLKAVVKNLTDASKDAPGAAKRDIQTHDQDREKDSLPPS